MQKHGILKSEVKCPGPLINNTRQFPCGKYMLLKKTNDSSDIYGWRCRRTHTVVKKEMKYKVKDVKLTLRHKSWIVDSKMSLELITEIMYLWSQGFNNKEIIHELKLTNKTVIEWCHFFRECTLSVVMEQSTPIGGPGIQVEIDESKFGKRKYHKGHAVEGQWVFGGREKNDKTKVFMIPVHNRKQETLIPLIQKWIKPGTIIHSDCWKSYNKLGKLGYTHLTVNHSKHFLDWRTGACTNGIESDWRHAKVHMPNYGINQGMHAGYLAEFIWRRRNTDNDLFLTLIQDINQTYVHKYLNSTPISFS